MVYSLQRNGARQIVAGNSTLAGAHYNGGPSLLPEGRKEAYNAGEFKKKSKILCHFPFDSRNDVTLRSLCFGTGVAFRNRYVEPSSCGETCLTTAEAGTGYGLVGEPNAGFNNYNTFANSSALSRTLLSASSFFLGLFGIKEDADPEHPYNALQVLLLDREIFMPSIACFFFLFPYFFLSIHDRRYQCSPSPTLRITRSVGTQSVLLMTPR